MVTAVEFDDLLAQVGSIASERGWSAVTDFISSLSVSGEILLLATEDVDSEPLSSWIASATGVRVTSAPLEGLQGDPAAGLYADQVIVAFRCGRFLTVSEIEATQQLMSRPRESYSMVFTHAEVIQDENDLHVLERGIWQTLAGDPDIRWAGQDLAEYRCLLWGAERPAAFMIDRVEHDKSLLRDWLRTPAGGRADFAALRAGYALDLAERAAALTRQEAPAPAHQRGYATLGDAQESLGELRRKLLRRLDTDAVALGSEVDASVEEFRRQLRGTIDRRVRQHADARWTDQELRQEIDGLVRLSLDSWQENMAATIAERCAQTETAAERLIRLIDWELVNSVCASRDGGYPDRILAHIRALRQAGHDVDQAPANAGSLSLPRRDSKTTAFRVTASGAAVAAVAAIFAWPAVIPLVAAGAAGAVGGSLLDRRLDTRSNNQAAEGLAAAAVNRTANLVLDAAREQVESAASSVRRAVTAEFRNLDETLHAAALRQAGQLATARLSTGAGGATAAAESDQARVARLRRQYDAALARQRA